MQKIGRLVKDEHVQRLLSHYGLSLTEPMTAPLFGAIPLQLAFYNEEHTLISRSVAPSLDYLSQDLGLVDKGLYEAIKQLELPEFFRRKLFDDTLKRGQQELNRYLRHLRPLLIEQQQIYLYCTTPISFQRTEVGSGRIVVERGKRPLIALPTSVQVAEKHGYSEEQIEHLAPSVAWLIPMLVVYRQVKETDELIACLDGWLAKLSPQQNEQIHTAFVKHVPYLVSKEVSRLLLPR
jgi:hypothetical protein